MTFESPIAADASTAAAGPPKAAPPCCPADRSVVDRPGLAAAAGDGVTVDGHAAGRGEERDDPCHLFRVYEVPDAVAGQRLLRLDLGQTTGGGQAGHDRRRGLGAGEAWVHDRDV